ncbi:MAG TPA: ATPase, T2SS/T4P/T4SS family, partial [Burkholderiales bacterium]
MSTAFATQPVQQDNLSEISSKLSFSKNLQAVTNKIHAASNIDEIMLEVSKDVCALFDADRLTIYTVSEDKASIVSKIKTGLNSFKDLKLPISDQSIAGYAACTQKMANMRDVYDDAELRALSPQLRFLQEVDKRTGYRTKQMLVAPILDPVENELLGVVQIINNKSDKPFPQVAEEGVQELCKTLAIAFKQRQKPAQALVRTKYDPLVAEAVISAAEFDLAARSARRKGVGIEEVLADEFQVKLADLGRAHAKFFGVDYEPFKTERIKPSDLLKNLKRDYVESEQWLPIEESKDGLVVLTPDPERMRSSRVANNVFPKHKITYRVTTGREFKQTVDQFFGETGDSTSIDDLLSKIGEDEEEGGVTQEDISAAADNELVKLVNKVIVDAFHMGASDIHIEPYPGKEKTVIRVRRDGSLMNYIEVPASYRNPLVTRLKIMCDLDISERRKPQDGKIKFKKFGPLDIELRVATLPTQGGVEDVVMRILAAGEPIPLEKLGLSEQNQKNLRTCVDKPYGLFFVCGP